VDDENVQRRLLGQRQLSRYEAQAVGDTAGRRRILQDHRDGTTVTSTTGETYPDFYGKRWDSFHRPRR
jgi:hypothetical protein